MRRKEQYADEIIEMLERTKGGAWASNINLNTKDRVIEVCQNCVDSWSGRKFKDHCTTPPQALEQTRWIPVSERLPKERVAVLVWCPERKNIYCACYEEKQWWIFGAYFNKVEFDVVAWMPLPEAWKESEDKE